MPLADYVEDASKASKPNCWGRVLGGPQNGKWYRVYKAVGGLSDLVRQGKVRLDRPPIGEQVDLNAPPYVEAPVPLAAPGFAAEPEPVAVDTEVSNDGGEDAPKRGPGRPRKHV